MLASTKNLQRKHSPKISALNAKAQSRLFEYRALVFPRFYHPGFNSGHQDALKATAVRPMLLTTTSARAHCHAQCALQQVTQLTTFCRCAVHALARPGKRIAANNIPMS
eukprot:1010246-Amphidinium_carterae.1